MMTSALDSYKDADFDNQKELLARQLMQSAEPANSPRAFLLGGQSGAGKTPLHKICSDKLGGNAIVVNGDEYRKSHPHFKEIQERYGMDAPPHTAAWSGAMTEALIDALSAEGFNLIIEGTLRTSDVPLATASVLKSRGYDVSLSAMAVKPEISLLSCQIRYEMMRIAGTTPRATDPAHHQKIVRDIVTNLAALDESGSFTSIELYDRAGERRFPASDAQPTAAATLEHILFGPWTPQERAHLQHLNDKLEQLKSL